MKWNKVVEASPPDHKIFSTSRLNIATRSKKSKLRQTPSSQKFKEKNEELMGNSFSAVIGQLNYEEDDSKKSMVEISRTLTEIRKIQQEQLDYQKKFMMLLQERGIRQKTTQKKSIINKSSGNKSTIKKSKNCVDMEEQMNTKIRKLESDIKGIKMQLQNSRSIQQSSKKSKSMARLKRL